MEIGEDDMAAFAIISEDILMNIFSKLEEDPRYLANLACVCTRFKYVIRTICSKRKCMRLIPSVVEDLLQTGRSADTLVEPTGGWAALQKLAVCCPGLRNAGVLLESSDFGLERDIGPSEEYVVETRHVQYSSNGEGTSEIHTSSPWTMFDDLHFEMEYQAELGFAENRTEGRVSGNLAENSIGEIGHDLRGYPCGFEQHRHGESVTAANTGAAAVGNTTEYAENLRENPIGELGHDSRGMPCGFEQHPHGESGSAANSGGSDPCRSHFSGFIGENPKSSEPEVKRKDIPLPDDSCDADSDSKRRRTGGQHPIEPHLARGVWNLTREQGNKLLQSRFRGDILYICDLPGCVHSEDKRNYSLFRGFFKNFKNSLVWRNINDMKAKKCVLNCAFCNSKGTWDMLTTFCLRRSFEYHDDGEPVVRAYVCENGHVAGAWTDRPMYN